MMSALSLAASAKDNSNTLVASYGINYAKFLAAYRSSLIARYATENLSANQRGIVAYLAQQRVKETELPLASNGDENPAPKLPPFGAEVPLDRITSKLNGNGNETAHSIVRSLTNDGMRPLVQLIQSPGQDAGVSTNNLRFNFENAMSRIRKTLMCAEIRSRFGMLGQRIVKILFEHHALEDKNIAEEALISLTDLHQLLLAMKDQGILVLQELLKAPASASTSTVTLSANIAANSGPDRNMKQSIFLWNLQERALLSLVRRRAAKSICLLRTRLRAECQQSIGGGSSSSDAYANISGPRAPENSAMVNSNGRIVIGGSSSGSNMMSAGQQFARQRFGAIQEHMSKSLVSLYEELALSIYC
jgi:hypothetical protein